MDSAIIVALLSLVGTFVGSIGGVLATQKMTSYRLDKLEETVGEITTQNTRLFKLEEHNTVQDVKIDSLTTEQKRMIEDIKKLRST